MKTVAFFPGQGSQQVGMGKDLCANFAVARAVFEEASEAIKLDLKKLCFEGPDTELVKTENTQPALLVTSVAAFRVAQAETGFKPDAVAGHSLGEYSALVAAGALPLAQATSWVKARGAAMQQAVPSGEGSMAAIMGLEDEPIEALCGAATESARFKRSNGENSQISVEAIVQPANFNAPGQTVIAGSVDALAEALSLIKTDAYKGGKAIPLSVSAPFHCKLMKPARDRMAEIFSKAAKPSALACPYVANRTARLTTEPGLIFELLIDQVDHPVLWRQSVQALTVNGFARGVEFGHGKVLAGLAKRIAGTALPVTNVGDSEGLKALLAQGASS